MLGTITHNQEKNGVQISFSTKPAPEVLSTLKSRGFRWSRFNKVWYSKVSDKALATAQQYGTLPATLTSSEDQHHADGARGMVQAQEAAMYERSWAQG